AEVSPLAEHGMLTAMVAGARMRLGAADGSASLGACWLGVRPGDLVVSSASSDDAIPARILAITPMHEKAVLLLRLADGVEWLAALPPDAPQGAADDAVFVRFAPDAAMLFDRATGLRIGQTHRLK